MIVSTRGVGRGWCLGEEAAVVAQQGQRAPDDKDPVIVSETGPVDRLSLAKDVWLAAIAAALVVGSATDS